MTGRAIAAIIAGLALIALAGLLAPPDPCVPAAGTGLPASCEAP